MSLFPSIFFVPFPLSLCMESLEKNQNAPRRSEHKSVKTFRWDHNRLQIIQNLFMAFKRVPLWYLVTLGQQYHFGEKPTVKLYTYMQSPCRDTMCVFSSHSFWTSSSSDVPAGVTQEEGHTRFLIHLLSTVRALIFLARRIQPFLSLVDREVEFCVLTI